MFFIYFICYLVIGFLFWTLLIKIDVSQDAEDAVALCVTIWPIMIPVLLITRFIDSSIWQDISDKISSELNAYIRFIRRF